MLKNRLLITGIVILLILSCTGCGSSNSGTQGTRIIRIAYNQATSHPHYRAVERAGERFQEETNGRYEFLLYPNAVLGDQRATVELMQNGAIDMCLVNNTIVENYNPDFALLGLPYVFSSEEHLREVFTSDLLDDLFHTTLAEGFETVAVYNSGSRNIYSTTEIHTPEDLKGLKIRVMESPSMIKMMNTMGGAATPMSQGEVYTAIQQGMLDGAENNEVTFTDMKHYEVAPVFSYTRHCMPPDLVLAGSDFLDELDEADRELFLTIMKESIDDEFDLWETYVEEVKESAAEMGVSFVDVDITPFQELCRPLVEEELQNSPFALELYYQISAIDSQED